MITKHLKHGTWIGRVDPARLTDEERQAIAAGKLGYCEGHRVLYDKAALPDCMVPRIFDGGLGIPCKEWPAAAAPKES